MQVGLAKLFQKQHVNVNDAPEAFKTYEGSAEKHFSADPFLYMIITFDFKYRNVLDAKRLRLNYCKIYD